MCECRLFLPLNLMISLVGVKTIFTYFNNSGVKFIKRQLNKVAHNVIKAITSLITSQILVEIAYCIEH